MVITTAPKAVELIATAVAAGTSAKDEDVFINAPLAPKQRDFLISLMMPFLFN